MRDLWGSRPLHLTESFCQTYTFVLIQAGTRLLGNLVHVGRHSRYIILDIFFYDFNTNKYQYLLLSRFFDCSK